MNIDLNDIDPYDHDKEFDGYEYYKKAWYTRAEGNVIFIKRDHHEAVLMEER